MKYSVELQYLPKGASRPLDQGSTIDVQTDDQGFAILPAVGDYINVGFGSGDLEGRAEFEGRVATRLFNYMGDFCGVNIVVEETDMPWGKLIKE
jgi:hypothetical protein